MAEQDKDGNVSGERQAAAPLPRPSPDRPVRPPANVQAPRPERKREAPRWTDVAIVVLTLGLFAVAWFQWDAMRGQLDAMREQVAEMKSGGAQTERVIEASTRIADATAKSVAASNRLADAAAQSSAESHRLAESSAQANAMTRRLADAAAEGNAITKRLADSASQANEINRKALLGVQRAFINVTGVELEPLNILGQEGAYWTALIGWANSGSTPSKNLVVHLDCFVSSKSADDPYLIPTTTPFYSHDEDTMRQVFGPRQTAQAGGCPLTAFDSITTMIGVPLHIYVTGRAAYRDIFDANDIHVTEFCYDITHVSVKTTAGKTPSISAIKLFCATHNCTDEDCDLKAREAAKRDLDKVSGIAPSR